MPVYPIHVPRKNYRGSKETISRKTAEYNRLVVKLEKYLNKKVEASEENVQIITYFEIAQAMGFTTETVCEILFPVDGGDNGITVWKKRSQLPSE